MLRSLNLLIENTISEKNKVSLVNLLYTLFLIFNKVLFMNILQKSYHCKDTHIGLSAGQNPSVLCTIHPEGQNGRYLFFKPKTKPYGKHHQIRAGDAQRAGKLGRRPHLRHPRRIFQLDNGRFVPKARDYPVHTSKA